LAAIQNTHADVCLHEMSLSRAFTEISKEGVCGPKVMTTYVAILLMIIAICAILVVGELAALDIFVANGISPGKYDE
jgi:hypothetical protein